jgi:hypothetical protein
MTLSALGIVSAAGAGGEGATGTYELIQSYILGSTTSSINFSSLATYASTYKHLQLRIVARGTNGAAGIVLKMRFNGDTGTNYTEHGLQSDGSSTSSFGGANSDYLLATAMTAAGATANSFSGMVIDILDSYSTTKNKTMRSLSGSTGFNRIILSSGVFRNTASMTSIDLFAAGNDIAAGSRFSLYGIRG